MCLERKNLLVIIFELLIEPEYPVGTLIKTISFWSTKASIYALESFKFCGEVVKFKLIDNEYCVKPELELLKDRNKMKLYKKLKKKKKIKPRFPKTIGWIGVGDI